MEEEEEGNIHWNQPEETDKEGQQEDTAEEDKLGQEDIAEEEEEDKQELLGMQVVLLVDIVE